MLPMKNKARVEANTLGYKKSIKIWSQSDQSKIRLVQKSAKEQSLLLRISLFKQGNYHVTKSNNELSRHFSFYK